DRSQGRVFVAQGRRARDLQPVSSSLRRHLQLQTDEQHRDATQERDQVGRHDQSPSMSIGQREIGWSAKIPLSLGSVSPLCHCAFDDETMTDVFRAFAVRAKPRKAQYMPDLRT